MENVISDGEFNGNRVDTNEVNGSDCESLQRQNRWNHASETDRLIQSLMETKKCCKIKRKKMILVFIIAAVIVIVLFVVAIGLSKNNVTVIDGCGAPPNVLHSSYLITGTNPGAQASYQCQPGYVLNGEKTVFCRDNGQWSNVLFSCTKDCIFPPYVPHSTFLKTENRSTTVSYYQCLYGYYLVGEPTIACQDNGEWSTVNFACFKYCNLPPQISQSTYQMTGNMSGAVASYQCLLGYYLVGEPNIVCSNSGDWSTTNLLCLQDCLMPPHVSHSTYLKTGNKSGVFASYQCLNGYYSVGESTIVCQEDGLWSNVKFSCLKYCGLPPYISSSTNHKTGNISGATASYRCLSGYFLVGKPEIVCENNGEWSTVQFMCLKDCGIPPTKPLSKVVFNDTYFGSGASYYCLNGLKAVGLSLSICQSDGKWTDLNLTCTNKEQSTPVPPICNDASIEIKFSRYGAYLLVLWTGIHVFAVVNS